MKKIIELIDWTSEQGLKAKGEASLARYNPSWRLPFMRRNEVIIPIHD